MLDTLKGQLITLDEDSDGISHELCGHVKDIVGKRGGDNDDLGRGRQVSVDIVDLVFETFVEQLISFIKDEDLYISDQPLNGRLTDLDVLGAEVTTTDHVENTTWRSADDLLTRLELSNILSDACTTNTSVA